MKPLSRARALPLLLLALATLALLRAAVGEPPPILHLGGLPVIALGGTSALLLAFVAVLGWLIGTYAVTNLRGQPRLTRFAGWYVVAVLALALMVTGASLALVAAGWTVSGLAAAALVGHAGTPAARRAARYVRRHLLVGDAFLWTGVLVGAVVLPGLVRSDLGDGRLDPVAATVVAVPLALAGVVRSALAPAHRWLPETAEAPSPVSALLHAGVVNGAGVIVILHWPLFHAAPAALLLLLVAGLASVALGTWAARLRADVKGRLACSTTAQMGYLSLQLGLGLPGAALLHLVGHGSYKAWLFLRAGGAVGRTRWTPADGCQVRSAAQGDSGQPVHRRDVAG